MKIVDIAFKVRGKEIPADHSYQLLSSLSRITPYLHHNKKVGIHPINGILLGDRKLRITDSSYLTIRMLMDDYNKVLPLSGKRIKINNESLIIGVPSPRAIKPSENLYSRLVIIKGYMEPASFLEAVKRQLTEMDIKGTPALIEQKHISEANKGKKSGTHSPYLRRTVRIRDKNIVGFAVKVTGLDEEDSIKLQEKGIGGRRRFGCGIFIGCRGE